MYLVALDVDLANLCTSIPVGIPHSRRSAGARAEFREVPGPLQFLTSWREQASTGEPGTDAAPAAVIAFVQFPPRSS